MFMAIKQKTFSEEQKDSKQNIVLILVLMKSAEN